MKSLQTLLELFRSPCLRYVCRKSLFTYIFMCIYKIVLINTIEFMQGA